MVGWWSYDVPEFEVTHYPLDFGFVVKTSEFSDHDLIFYEDGKMQGVIRKDIPMPVVYHVVDSTLSEDHYQHRMAQAKLNADAVCVDWDRLDRFTRLNMPVFRFNYCINDRLFFDWVTVRKTVDVGVFHNSDDKRIELENWLTSYCKEKRYSLEIATHSGKNYAEAMNRCKVVINLNRNPETRSHRIFDTMGCNTCMLTSPPPEVSGEKRLAGKHYWVYRNFPELGESLDYLIGKNGWHKVARRGFDLTHRHHTWSKRAKQLHQKLTELFFND